VYVHVDVKERRRQIGWVADLCPVCRDLRAFRVSEVRRVARVYLVPMGKGSLEGIEIACVDCGCVLPGAEAGYEAVSRRRREPSRLVEETNPALLDRSADWFERQRRVALGELSGRERVAEILRTLEALEHMAQRRSRGGAEEAIAAISVVVLIVLLIGAAAAWTPSVGASPAWRTIITAGAAGMLPLTAWLVFAHTSLAASRHVMPRLVRALAPLEPTLEELDGAVALARRAGLRIGRYVRPGAVLIELARERRQPTVLSPPGAG
jgi:hypothetical protein